jgi:hypothetical protein
MKMNITPPAVLVQNLSLETDINPESSEMEVWDPPFERWMRLADALLEESALERRLNGGNTRPC